MPTTLSQCWRAGAQELRAAGIANADRDAQLLLLAHLGFETINLISKENLELSDETLQVFQTQLERRKAGEPIARILGTKEFYGLAFDLNAHTLVPRPETELLVDLGLEFIAERTAPRVLDLGAGSGAILVSLLVNSANASGIGIDLSEQALKAAKLNANSHGVFQRSTFLVGSWFAPLSKLPSDDLDAGARFDLIVSNPPYIRPDIIKTLDVDVREFDPVLALDGGEDGLDAYRAILRDVSSYLASDGCLMFEIGHDQGQSVLALCQRAGFAQVSVQLDIAGLNRVVVAKN